APRRARPRRIGPARPQLDDPRAAGAEAVGLGLRGRPLHRPPAAGEGAGRQVPAGRDVPARPDALQETGEVTGRAMSSPSDPTPAPDPGHVVGPRPWFPWPLSRWRWWNEPVRAERLAALRIGLALILLIDVLTSYLPLSADFFSRGGIGDRALFAYRFEYQHGDRKGQPTGRWSLLRHVDDPAAVRLAMAAWAGSTFLLLIGLFTR